MLITFIRLALFLISSIGYWEFFRKNTKMNIYFLPAFTVSSQISVLFLAGLLNCLKSMTVILFIVGLILATYYVFKYKKCFLKYMWGTFLLYCIMHSFNGTSWSCAL